MPSTAYILALMRRMATLVEELSACNDDDVRATRDEIAAESPNADEVHLLTHLLSEREADRRRLH